MPCWLERYSQNKSLEDFSRDLFAYRYSSVGLSNIVDQIIKLLKSGIAAGAIIAALSAAGYSGENWAEVVKKADKSVKSSSKVDMNEMEKLVENKVPDDSLNRKLFELIKGYEGAVPKVYKDDAKKENPTIGVGHLLTEESRNKFSKLFGKEVNFDDIKSGRQSLTEEQMEKLFFDDVKSKLNSARSRIKNFDNLHQDTRNAIINSLYRGDIGPKTISLMNEGKWVEASKEYLNHKEYKEIANAIKMRSKNVRNRGVYNRMNQNATAFANQANM